MSSSTTGVDRLPSTSTDGDTAPGLLVLLAGTSLSGVWALRRRAD